MKSTIRFGAFIIAAGVSLPLLLSLYKNSFNNRKDLNTCMDVQAIVNEEPMSEATASETIDTMTKELASKEKESEEEDEQKRKQVVQLVEEAISFVNNNSFDKAMSAFTHGRDFIRGELYLFVYDYNGFEFANGQDERLVWRNVIDMRDPFGTFIIKTVIDKAKEGGGWVVYQWRNATKNSYIRSFVKDGKEYAIGAGYYPHSKHDIVVGLVKAAVAYFNEVVIEKGFPVDEVFSTLSYPAGRFVMGDLYLYALDFKGQMMANGDRPGLIGSNVLMARDSEGKLLNQEIIKKLQNSTDGVWIEYISKNAKKMAYAQKVADRDGREFFIAAGYYPSATPNRAVDLVKNGYEFLKKHGLTAAVNEFSTRQSDTYRYGDLYLVLWDMKGRVIANGANLDAIGVNQWDLKDEDGKLFVQEIIEKAKSGGGWVDFKLRNAFQSIYVEAVDLGTDSYVIASGLYPISKRETALLLSRSAAGYLETHSREEAFSEFTNPNGKFMRGDLFTFVVGFDGVVKVWGDIYELIWRNIMDAKDDAGKPYIQVFINTVKQGPGQVSYKINGFERVALVDLVEKDGTSYVVGTAYYK